jgi:hypothetical protein
VKIRIPDNNIPERTWIIEVLMREFIDADYVLETYQGDRYELILADNKSILIKDAFFNQSPEPLSYLKKEHIPEKICFSVNQFSPESNIPVLFGTPEVVVNEYKISCSIDIFASSFFMLSRWEEYVINERDQHSRVPDRLQCSVKQGIYERPVVNEYIEFLRNMMKYLGFDYPCKRTPEIIITHDIDFFARYDSVSKLMKAMIGDIVKRKSIRDALRSLQTYFKMKKGESKDPYDTFEYLMKQSESIGLKSQFYFIPALKGEPDAQYNINNKKLVATITNIINSGHTVGVHGSYRSYNNADFFQEELKRFPVKDISENRQHFLRFQNPDTWQMLEDSGIEVDSSMGFINRTGFRSGICYEYPVFNILSRKTLNLKERPLIVMDQALRKEIPNQNSFYEKIIDLTATVKKYSGTFVLLWHNTNFNVREWKGYSEIYERLIKSL